MDQINEITYEALVRYFTRLSQVGYMNEAQIKKLILLIFLQEILTGGFNVVYTEDEFKILTKVFYCLTGSSCLITYPDSIPPEGSFFVNYRNPAFRITEVLNNLRTSESGYLRIKA